MKQSLIDKRNQQVILNSIKTKKINELNAKHYNIKPLKEQSYVKH